VSATLRVRDGTCTLVTPAQPGQQQRRRGDGCILWGQPQLDALKHHLEQQVRSSRLHSRDSSSGGGATAASCGGSRSSTRSSTTWSSR
jgi:hypothetical protein